jgi:hypothetical protein
VTVKEIKNRVAPGLMGIEPRGEGDCDLSIYTEDPGVVPDPFIGKEFLSDGVAREIPDRGYILKQDKEALHHLDEGPHMPSVPCVVDRLLIGVGRIPVKDKEMGGRGRNTKVPEIR